MLAGFALGFAMEWLLRSLPPIRGTPNDLAASAPPSVWTVHVNARPWAWIRIDGKEAGATPLVQNLAAGPHQFEARFPDGRQERRVVEIGRDSRFVAFR